MNDDSSNAAGLLQPHIGPGFSRVRGFVDSIADYIAIADDPSLACSRPHYTGVSWCDRKRANRCGGLLIENRSPAVAAVGRFPYTAGSGSGVVCARIARHPSHGGNAVSNARTNKAESKLALFI